ncbi:DNA circularization protein [Pseudomonas knackmussii]|uniref:DNA circularization protein n=1 Tax=Pseudomonas knackmussii TaxID=65741 RepID=UPI0013630924|nr:DNA circularization N-terminal domain-containing protein [Pseudomonas knackmussii]
MSWSETLLDASYRGIPLNVVDENLQAQRALSEHGSPYRNGDSVDDLGRGARRFPMRVVLFGVNYEIELQNLLKALDTSGDGELIHPIYGSVTVVAASWEVGHSAERPDSAQVSIQFVESLPDQPFFAREIAFVDVGLVAADDGPTWQDGIFDLFGRIDSLVSDIQTWIGGGWVGLLEQTLGLPGIGLRLQQLRSQILGVVTAVDEMANSTSSAFDPLADLARTPTEIRGAIQTSTPSDSASLLSRSGVPAAMPGASSLPADASRAAATLLASARQGVDPDESLLPSSMPSDPVAENAFGLVVLVITELALAHAQAVAVIIEAEAETPTLSPDDLESLANLARSLAQASILLHRRLYDVETARPIIEGLRNTSALLQARARRVILMAPPLVERTVQTPASLRLLAHRWYGDHTRAAELLRLNPGLQTPYSIEAGEVLRAYVE